MKINELLNEFTIYTSLEEQKLLDTLSEVHLLNSFSEREQFIIEGMIRKSLVIKIGDKNPKVVANEF
jgi:hypothetical protein